MSVFLEALRNKASQGLIPVIPDFKLISPAEGPLFHSRDPVSSAAEIAAAGAPVLSVVTEKNHFGGSLELLREIMQAAKIPVLRKDFIESAVEVEETASAGASAVLLICASMSEVRLRECYAAALSMGLDALVEAHTAEELKLAADLGCPLVGINNRNILQLEKDGGSVSRTADLAALKPHGAFLVSESGLQGPADVQRAIRSGADGVLIGTAIWRAPDPIAFYRSLCKGERAT